MTDKVVLQLLAAALNLDVEALSQHASFVSLGGDSMAALRFSMACKRHKICVPVDVVLSSPSIAQLKQQCLSQRETATCPSAVKELACLVDDHLARSNTLGKRSRSNSIDSLDSIPSVGPIKHPRLITPPMTPPYNEFDSPSASHRGLQLAAVETVYLCPASNTNFQMSETQISLLHGSLESPHTNIIYYGETQRPAYAARLKAAWKQVCKSEPIFCTTYCNPEDGQPIRPRLRWRELRTSKWDVYHNARLAAGGPGLPWLEQPDSEAGPAGPGEFAAVRFTELHYDAPSPNDRQTLLIWAVHHALIDGWSAELLVRKVHEVASGGAAQPGPSFTNVCLAQQQLRLNRRVEGNLFWAQQREKLATAREELLLEKPVTESMGVETSAASGDQRHFVVTLDSSECASLKAAAQSCLVTTASFFYAAWAVCLGLYTDSDNVVVGTVVSGRNIGLPGIYETVGPMINMLPLQIDLHWKASARELVQDVFGRLQRLSHYSWTTPENGFSRVRGNLMAMTSGVRRWSDGSSDSRMGPSFFKNTTNLPLSIVVTEDSGSVVLQYSSERYNHNCIQIVAKLFKASLLSLCQTEAILESASLVLSACHESLGTMGNWYSRATSNLSITSDLVTLFEKVAFEWPFSYAIECEGQKMTYCELERLSGEVAHTLAGLIEPEEVVAVHADGSINWIISIYGILRAGGVYCPLDKAHPQEYRNSLFESSTARMFLATTTEALSMKPDTAATAIDVEALLGGSIDCSSPVPRFHLRARPQPQNRAYLVFTSGSTGKPKGVMCTHQGLVAFQSDLEVRLFAAPGTKIAQTMSLAFDGAIHEVFSALSYGACLVLRQMGEKGGLNQLKAADSAILTPSLASALNPDDFPRLKTVYLVGEAVPQSVCDLWATSKALYNMYGPTEATCGATIKRLLPGRPVTIGGPNPTTRIYILDHHQRLAPPGRVGEIYLAGVQVAQGYLGRPEITAERFLPDPFCCSEEFMYKTGDRGYWNEAGDIVFLGRIDRQIKLRGFRVDLEDLEARVLRACNEARAVAITHREDDLICMIQSTSADVAGMQNEIRKALPAFAVPRYVFIAKRLPMTANLKVNYRAIAAQCENDIVGGRHEEQEPLGELATETEATVAKVWNQVLGAAIYNTNIGPNSSFTQLGGHSLQQLQLTARLRAIFGSRITMRMIAGMPTLRDLAAAIDKIGQRERMFPASPLSNDGDSSQLGMELRHDEASPMEKEWWYKTHLNRGSSAFNVSWVARHDSKMVCLSRMAEAWNTVLARHCLFRVRYVKDHQGGLRRIVEEPAQVEWRRCLDVRKELNRPFDLAAAPPVRVCMNKDKTVAIWSHIVCDYTTLSLVLNEVAAAYHGSALPPPKQPHVQRPLADAPSLNFWTQYLGDVKDRRSAYLGIGAERTSYGGQSLMARVSTSLWHRMQNRARQSGVTLQQLLMAASALAVGAEDDELDITIGTPFINRHSEAEMQAIGLFLEPLPVRVRHNEPKASVASYIRSVQASAQQALVHTVPWDQLLNHLDVDATKYFPNHPLFDCVASFHDPRRGQPEQGGGPWSSSIWGEGVEPMIVWSDGAKFKLMVECLACDDDTLLLRLEYDEVCYGSDEGRMSAVRRMILTAIDAVASRDECPFEELQRELRTLWRAEKASGFQVENNLDAALLEDDRDLFLQPFRCTENDSRAL